VEVSTDGGQSWKDAEFKTPNYRMAHARFALPWKWDGKECVLLSRCTDELGTRQPSRAESAKFFNKPLEGFRVPGNDNTVQPWRVASDGSVHNGLA
jgi:sulfane dehydrogenase subunit SoxC